MNLRRLTLAFSLVGASSLGLFGCGGSSNDFPEILTLEGRAIDGYLSNAYVCVDLNRNRICDSGEPSDTTDSVGNFSIQSPDSDAPLILESLADTFDVNEEELVGEGLFLTAPNNSATLTPLTTLAQIRSELAGESYSDAENAVIEDLGLTGSVTNLGNFDYIAQQETSTAARKAANSASAVAKIIRENAVQLGSGGDQKSKRGGAVFSLMVNSGQPNTPLQSVATTVNTAIDADEEPPIDDIVEDNTPDIDDLEDLVEDIEEAEDDDDVIEPGTGGTGGGSV